METIFENTWKKYSTSIKSKILLAKMKVLLTEILSLLQYNSEVSVFLKPSSQIGKKAWPQFNKYGYEIDNKKFSYSGGLFMMTCPAELTKLNQKELLTIDMDFLRQLDGKDGELKVNFDASLIHPLDELNLEKSQRIGSNVPDFDVHGVLNRNRIIVKMQYMLHFKWVENKTNNSTNIKDYGKYLEDYTRYVELSFGVGGHKHGKLKHCTRLCGLINGCQYKIDSSGQRTFTRSYVWNGIMGCPSAGLYKCIAKDKNGHDINGRYRINLNALSLSGYFRLCSLSYELATNLFPMAYQKCFIPVLWKACNEKLSVLSRSDIEAIYLIANWTNQSDCILSGFQVCNGDNCGVTEQK